MMKRLIKVFALLMIFVPILAYAQPSNYWSNSFNTEASLLSGAVVGGNAEITAIFYNPAGISDIVESRFDLNASLFNLESKTYSNPLGEDTQMENLSFRVFPRFTSYLYQSKKYKNLTYQFAIFNRNSSKTVLYSRVQLSGSDLIYHNFQEQYTGLFELASNFDDYWGSLGISKKINENWSVGISMNVSIQSLTYFRSAIANAIPTNYQLGDSIPLFSSTWQSNERINAYNWRFIGKLGVIYRKNNWNLGFNLTLPSVKLFGNADVSKTVSQTNIFYKQNKVADFYLNEYPQYVYFNIKEPLSVAFGFMYDDKESISTYFFTLEYFAPISEYYTIDPSKGVSNKSILGSEFSAYKMENKQIINIALGYRKMLSKTLGFLAGFRTDFNPYILGYNEKYWEENSFENLNINLYHLTGGVKFNYKKSSFIVGLQQSFGYQKNQKEFINFSNPNSYNPDTQLALQGEKSNHMDYTYRSLGFYLGFSVVF